MTLRDDVRSAQAAALEALHAEGLSREDFEDAWCFTSDREREEYLLEQDAPLGTIAASIQERALVRAGVVLGLRQLASSLKREAQFVERAMEAQARARAARGASDHFLSQLTDTVR